MPTVERFKVEPAPGARGNSVEFCQQRGVTGHC
jgi:hypothetical protein